MILYRNRGTVEVSLRPLGEGEMAWLDVVGGPGAMASQLVETLALERSAAERVSEGQGRSDVFLTLGLKVLRLMEPGDDDATRLLVVVGKSWVITGHDGSSAVVDEVTSQLREGHIAFRSTEHMAYRIFLQVADAFLDLADQKEDDFDQLEDEVVGGQGSSQRIFALRRTLHHMRRVIADQRRVAGRMARLEEDQGSSSDAPYLDVYDTLYHVIDNIDSLRDNLTGLVDLQLNQRSMRLNEVMKVLTIFSTIFLPLSFVTGYFGMNWHSMTPVLSAQHGQVWVLALMAAIAATMLFYFKRRRWL